ncbi:MAG TPA: alpha/beta hydrolase [Kofleriaceae bacterium]|nr:alpha/beta hydrolase [Kofleriaceae bacterium]
MPRVAANGIELEYEVLGTGEPMVLVMGLGAQLVQWPQGLVDEIVARGFQVIRFDNRDVGLSTRLHDLPVPDVRAGFVRALLGLPIRAPYTLLDMADDVAGLLDGLGLRDVHLVGASLGGMVAQTTAVVHSARVRSLCSIMSTTGSRRAFARPRAIRALLGKPPKTREQAIARQRAYLEVCGSTGFPIDWELSADIAGRAWDRAGGAYPRGFARQLAAIFATGDRSAALRLVRAPTVVIHGEVDPLIPVVGGRLTARAIPGAQLMVIPGMGHDLPRGVWTRIADAIADNARRADQARRARAQAA